MRAWGVSVNDAFFLGGIEKSKVLKVLRPHIFFDDQQVHLDGAIEYIAGVHIPYGVANVASPVANTDVAFPPDGAVEPEMADVAG